RVGRGREGGTCGLVKDSGAVVAGERVSVGGNGEVAHRQVREAGRILHLNSHLGIAGELAGGDRGVDGVAASGGGAVDEEAVERVGGGDVVARAQRNGLTGGREVVDSHTVLPIAGVGVAAVVQGD